KALAVNEEDALTILKQVWKPRNIGPDTKFRAALNRISTKLSTLDEVEDLSLMLKSKNPPFGRFVQHVPPGWGAAHDRWLAQSAYDQGWFTSMQKKRAYKIMEDPTNTWPGLITMPEHVVIGRRLKALVVKFRDDKKQAARDVARAIQVARDAQYMADLAERNRKTREMEDKNRREREIKEARRAKELAAATARRAFQK
ncbi:unnamed protein product, partial [Laminaria digitata]